MFTEILIQIQLKAEKQRGRVELGVLYRFRTFLALKRIEANVDFIRLIFPCSMFMHTSLLRFFRLNALQNICFDLLQNTCLKRINKLFSSVREYFFFSLICLFRF
jgi:hypothetical protein